MATRVSFADWDGPVKNPSAGGGASTAPAKVQRIDVLGGSTLTKRQVGDLVEVIQANKLIGPAIAAEVRASIPLDNGFDRGYANLKAIAKSYTPAEAIMQRVQEILVSKMARQRVV